MSNGEINEFFYTLRNHFASHTAQREPTWEEIVTRQAQTSISQQAYNFEGGNHFNNNAAYFSPPHNYMPSYYHSGWGTYDITPMDIQLCKVKEVQVSIIKSTSDNHLKKSYSLH